MIVRKPYAFLIKNFRKIHIALLVFSLYIAFKLIDVNSFVNEFMRLGTYDVLNDPIGKHLSIWVTIAILFLLYYKKKPWKIYLIPIIEYVSLLFVLSMIRGFFNIYSSTVDMADLRLTKDLLLIFILGQVAPIGIYAMRVLGLDMKKFQFNFDKEFLELSDEDREEVEIGISFDKYSFIRGFKRFKRNLHYFYLEHKTICSSIFVIIVLFTAFEIWHYFFVVHKSYSLGDVYNVNGYTFKVNHAYYTDKDYNGNVISTKSNFLVIDLSVINHSKARTVYLENFHIRNGISDFLTTRRIYSKEFQDFGVAYESSKKLQKDEQLDLIIIYKVDKALKKNRFVLYYQEKNGILRKIKLKVDDLSEIKDVDPYSLGDNISLNLQKVEEKISFDYAELTRSATHIVRRCGIDNCSFKEEYLTVPEEFRILRIDFSSDTYEFKNMIDFLKNYGKLNYIDNEDKVYTLEIERYVLSTDDGKTIFLKVPMAMETAKEIYFEFTVRNQHFIYKIMEEL